MFKAMKIGFGLMLGAKMAEFVYEVMIKTADKLITEKHEKEDEAEA